VYSSIKDLKFVEKQESKGKPLERAGRKAANLNADVRSARWLGCRGKCPVKLANDRIEKKEILVLVLVGFLFCAPASAGSKTTTVQVSCTITPMMEMSVSSAVHVASNLDTKYQMTESAAIERGLQKIKLHTLTAL